MCGWSQWRRLAPQYETRLCGRSQTSANSRFHGLALCLGVSAGVENVPLSAVAGPIFCLTVTQRSPFPRKNGLASIQTQMGDENMRVLIICALVITATVGVSGCFHHQKAVTQEPLKLG